MADIMQVTVSFMLMHLIYMCICIFQALQRRKASEVWLPSKRACRICKSKVMLQMNYCNDCAHKKGICTMCGRKSVDTSGHKMSLTWDNMNTRLCAFVSCFTTPDATLRSAASTASTCPCKNIVFSFYIYEITHTSWLVMTHYKRAITQIVSVDTYTLIHGSPPEAHDIAKKIAQFFAKNSTLFPNSKWFEAFPYFHHHLWSWCGFSQLPVPSSVFP